MCNQHSRVVYLVAVTVTLFYVLFIPTSEAAIETVPYTLLSLNFDGCMFAVGSQNGRHSSPQPNVLQVPNATALFTVSNVAMSIPGVNNTVPYAHLDLYTEQVVSHYAYWDLLIGGNASLGSLSDSIRINSYEIGQVAPGEAKRVMVTVPVSTTSFTAAGKVTLVVGFNTSANSHTDAGLGNVSISESFSCVAYSFTNGIAESLSPVVSMAAVTTDNCPADSDPPELSNDGKIVLYTSVGYSSAILLLAIMLVTWRNQVKYEYRPV